MGWNSVGGWYVRHVDIPLTVVVVVVIRFGMCQIVIKLSTGIQYYAAEHYTIVELIHICTYSIIILYVST